MPIHDWTIVDAGIFHAFHQQWLIGISNALNGGLLPGDYYALPEQHGAGYEPDVLTLERAVPKGGPEPAREEAGHDAGRATALLLEPPKIAPTAEAPIDFYRRKQNSLVIRHVSGDRMVAIVEIVSPGNKSGVAAFRKFVEKASSFLLRGVHLLIVDLFPPGPRDPAGIHGAVWDDVAACPYEPPGDKPLAAVAYESGVGIRAFVRHMAVGDDVPEMPLFLEANACVYLPLAATYRAAFAAMPLRWREVLDAQ